MGKCQGYLLMLSSVSIVRHSPAAVPSDAELLARVSNEVADQVSARAAQAEFYRRHARYLYGVLVRRVSERLALSGREVEDLVQETFFRAFAHAKSYQGDDAGDPEAATRRTRAWLGRIAQHLLADWLNGTKEVSASPFLEHVAHVADDGPPSSRSPRRVRLREALELLSERERDVLVVSALYHRPGEEHQRLPNAVSQELAARWATSAENIRAIRSRAMKKLRDHLEARSVAPTEES